MTETIIENKKKLYTPEQVALGSLFGTVLTASYFLYKNIDYFGENKKNKLILLIGLVFMILMSSSVLVYGYDISSASVGMAVVMYIYVRKDLRSRDIKVEDMNDIKQSWFNVVVITIGFFLVSAFLLFANAMLLDALGIINFEVMEQK